MSDQSSVTSIDDDITENFIENPSRELLAEGFLNFFSPLVENLDSRVKTTQLAQININAQLDILTAIIQDQIRKQEKFDCSELDEAYRKLQLIRSKVTVLTNVLQGTHDRLTLVNKKIEAFEASQSQEQ